MSAWVTLTYRSAEQTITRNYYRSSVRALSAHHTFCHLFGKLPIHQKSEGGGKLSVITLQGRDHTSSLTVTTRPVQPQDMPTVLLRALGARGDELLPLRLMRPAPRHPYELYLFPLPELGIDSQSRGELSAALTGFELWPGSPERGGARLDGATWVIQARDVAAQLREACSQGGE